MVERFGMAPTRRTHAAAAAAAMSLAAWGGGAACSEGARSAADAEADALVAEGRAAAERLLRAHVGALHAVARRLVECGTLTGDQLRQQLLALGARLPAPSESAPAGLAPWAGASAGWARAGAAAARAAAGLVQRCCALLRLRGPEGPAALLVPGPAAAQAEPELKLRVAAAEGRAAAVEAQLGRVLEELQRLQRTLGAAATPDAAAASPAAAAA
jgi:hypothetical protein